MKKLFIVGGVVGLILLLKNKNKVVPLREIEPANTNVTLQNLPSLFPNIQLQTVPGDGGRVSTDYQP